MYTRCIFCAQLVDKNDPKTWKQVIGWVGGPKKDSMRLRSNTGHYAHDECVGKVMQGQAPTQDSILNESPAKAPMHPSSEELEFLE